MSPRFKLNQQDLAKWSKNALIFLAPAALSFLLTVQKDAEAAGTSVVVLYLLNLAVDLFRKWYANNK